MELIFFHISRILNRLSEEIFCLKRYIISTSEVVRKKLKDFAYTNVHGKVVSDINQFNFGHQNPGKIFPNYEDVAEVLDVVKCQYEKTFQLLEVLPTKSQNNPL